MIAYNAEEFIEQPLEKLSDLAPLLDRYGVTWLDVDGLGDPALIQQIGDLFGFHRLALEDVANVNQRAKMEAYGEYHFIVTRMIVQLSEQLDTEQFSMFVGTNYVVTFQEKPGDCLETVRTRIRTNRGRIRKAGPDHLFYALLDAVIDAYFPVLELYGERMDNLEDEIIAVAQPDTIARIHDLKRDLLQLRRAVWPLREVLNTLLRDANPLITEETRLYLRDCYDHIVRIMDLVENYRELAADLMDLYLSMVSNRMNEVMKVLTIIATIFIPLTFIVGVYGMNFKHMPELDWDYGYAFAWILMLLVTLGMVMFFRRKGWIGKKAPRIHAGY
ncbi:MAG: magnesium/cobalt transporter CorA [Bdellovibrionota bacterium]